MPDNTNPKAPTQIDWVDGCKGLGIYLVALGHSHIPLALQLFIYTFHMPLFFFLSGYVHSVKANTAKFFWKRSIQLLLPYLTFLLVLYPVHTVGFLRHHGWDHQLVKNTLVTVLWGGSRLKEAFGVLWFLPCLFFTQQLMNYLLLRFRLRRVGYLVVGGLLLAYAQARWLPQFSLPLDLHVVLAAMPFFYAGVLLRRKAWPGRVLTSVGVLGAALTVWLVSLKYPVAYNMRDGVYGIPGLSLLLALCCIFAMLGVSRAAVSAPLLRRVTTALGVASLGIMFIHKEVMDLPGIVTWARHHGYLASILITVIAYYTTVGLRQTVVTRAFFLGSEKDFSVVRGWIFPSAAPAGRTGSRPSRAA